MEKTTKILLIALVLIFSFVMGGCTSPKKTGSTPVTKEDSNVTKTMYFKSGRTIECDILWEGMGSEICCKKSGNIIAYSAGDVDLIRTFGESSAAEIAERYKERVEIVKQRELMSRPIIETPEEARRKVERKLRREREIAAAFEESIRVEQKRLGDRGEWRKIGDLVRDPELYFKMQSEVEEKERRRKARAEEERRKARAEAVRIDKRMKELVRKMESMKKEQICIRRCMKRGDTFEYCEAKCRYR